VKVAPLYFLVVTWSILRRDPAATEHQLALASGGYPGSGGTQRRDALCARAADSTNRTAITGETS
jgi:hypothetical protein